MRHILYRLGHAMLMVSCAILSTSPFVALRAQRPSPSIIVRRYRLGDSLHYVMSGSHEDRTGTVTYSARADGRVAKDSLGRYVEEFQWSELVRDGRQLTLPLDTNAVRQRLTLLPDAILPPVLGRVDPRLIGPFLDLYTFYADLWLATKMSLIRPGDHAYVPRKVPNSWADGRIVMLGEDAVDFDLMLMAVDSAAGRARLEVRHVPPAAPVVRLPATWMKTPVSDVPNNWVQVTRVSDSSFVAAVGRESFDVVLDVRLDDGAIEAATMDNPVDVVERVCGDVALTVCNAPSRYRIHRRITLRSRPDAR